jgi:hypothetical protein
MTTSEFHLGFERKIGYSFLGLLAGNLICLAAFSFSTLVARFAAPFGPLSDSWHARMLQVLGLAIVYGIVSMAAWAVIGLPVVLSLSAKLTAQLHWSLALLIGAVLGAVAPAVLVVSFDGWQRTIADIKKPPDTEITFFAAAVIIGGVAFSVHCALVRYAMRNQQRKSGAPRGTPQFFSVLD